VNVFSTGQRQSFVLIHSLRKATHVCVAIFACMMLSFQPVLAQVVPDGRTQTTITGAGAVSNVPGGG